MTTFTLTIELGNAEMQKPQDVADAIMGAAHRIADDDIRTGNIRDTNGNTVGAWKFGPDDAALGKAFREMWEELDAEKDESGILPGSAADLAADVYAVYVAHGYPVA